MKSRIALHAYYPRLTCALGATLLACAASGASAGASANSGATGTKALEAAEPDSTSPGLEGTVALAMVAAHEAHARADDEALIQALEVIERSGARPLPDWEGRDPVADWRNAALSAKPAALPPAFRGSPLGPGYRTGKVLAGARERFEQVFMSGQKASIALATPGSDRLTLRVVDRDKNPVCEARRGACQWIPLFTQRYAIEISNRGKRVAEYFLVVD